MIRKRYAGWADFLTVYQREAHATDGWRMDVNDRDGVLESTHRSLEDRAQSAHRFCRATRSSVTTVVDDMEDSVSLAYSGAPDRLYLIDRDGRVAYKGGRGPLGLNTDELEQALILLLLRESLPVE